MDLGESVTTLLDLGQCTIPRSMSRLHSQSICQAVASRPANFTLVIWFGTDLPGHLDLEYLEPVFTRLISKDRTESESQS